MAVRKSQAEQVSRNNLAVEGAKAHQAALPAETKKLAATLAAHNAKIQALNAKQEAAKAALTALTQQVNAELKAAAKVRARMVKAAEFAFGTRGTELKAFRPATEGRG